MQEIPRLLAASLRIRNDAGVRYLKFYWEKKTPEDQRVLRGCRLGFGVSDRALS